MALDCYIVEQDHDYGHGPAYTVKRYKNSEHLEAVNVTPKASGSNNSYLSKRLRVVDQFIKDGSPDHAVYWFEGNEVKGMMLGKKAVFGNMANGEIDVWVHGKRKTIKFPKGMEHLDLVNLIHGLVKKDKDDDQFVGSAGASSTNTNSGTLPHAMLPSFSS